EVDVLAFNSLYRGVLRLPQFKGKSLLEKSIRKALFTPAPSLVAGGLLMELDPLEWPQVSLIKDGCLEPLTTALYGELLATGDTYVDVGAHVGFHTLVARGLVGARGRVIAIEPQPYNCERILNNWRANGFENIMLYVAAAGNRDCSVVLSDQSPTDKSRLSLCLDPVNDQHQRFKVPMVRLSTVLEEQRVDRVRLLKIDVEGFEPEVIEGLGAWMDRVDNIVLEVLGAPAEISAKGLALLQNIQAAGLSLYTIAGETLDIERPIPENNVWAARVQSLES